MVALRAKVSWIHFDHRRLAVGEMFEVESERHAAPLLKRGDAELAPPPPPPPPPPPSDVAESVDAEPAVEPPTPKPAASTRKPRAPKA